MLGAVAGLGASTMGGGLSDSGSSSSDGRQYATFGGVTIGAKSSQLNVLVIASAATLLLALAIVARK